MPLVLRGATAYLDNSLILENSDITIDEGKILAIRPAKSEPVPPDSKIIGLSNDTLILPGFIDMHIHGAMGCDVMDATPDSLSTIAKTLPNEGVSGFLATTMSASIDEIEAALVNINTYKQSPKDNHEAQLLGIHLEGPFLSEDKAGVHLQQHLIAPDMALFNHWQALSGHLIKLVTIAPELDNALLFIKAITEQGIIASIGHTNASFEQTQLAIEAGATHATHLFNAMTPMHHRHPGAATALLLDERVNAELIVDHEHLHPAMVKLAYQQKGAENILLVTDAMKAKCLSPGQYTMSDQTIIVDKSSAKTNAGILSGSILTMNQAVANMQNITKGSVENMVIMASTSPANALGLYPQKGSIGEGTDADLIIMDKAFNINAYVISGHYHQVNDKKIAENARAIIDNSHLADSI